ncbi:hypothetical protein NJLHNGOC_11345 [Novacetimonas cocois]|uniref:Uncharacterized protein n=1 Tax=Novacetimonas cocois TaxID=1747507 RepID=A0A365YUV7_9PROT|nr:hypothetical protein NJLHNGOC_11345 [Novacetimonas cocois]
MRKKDPPEHEQGHHPQPHHQTAVTYRPEMSRQRQRHEQRPRHGMRVGKKTVQVTKDKCYNRHAYHDGDRRAPVIIKRPDQRARPDRNRDRHDGAPRRYHGITRQYPELNTPHSRQA